MNQLFQCYAPGLLTSSWSIKIGLSSDLPHVKKPYFFFTFYRKQCLYLLQSCNCSKLQHAEDQRWPYCKVGNICIKQDQFYSRLTPSPPHTYDALIVTLWLLLGILVNSKTYFSIQGGDIYSTSCFSLKEQYAVFLLCLPRMKIWKRGKQTSGIQFS